MSIIQDFGIFGFSDITVIISHISVKYWYHTNVTYPYFKFLVYLCLLDLWIVDLIAFVKDNHHQWYNFEEIWKKLVTVFLPDFIRKVTRNVVKIKDNKILDIGYVSIGHIPIGLYYFVRDIVICISYSF